MRGTEVMFEIVAEPAGPTYEALLACALLDCNRFSVVTQASLHHDTSTFSFLSELSPFLVSERIVTEWPGTRLHGPTATLWTCELSQAAMPLLQRVQSLYSWRAP